MAVPPVEDIAEETGSGARTSGNRIFGIGIEDDAPEEPAEMMALTDMEEEETGEIDRNRIDMGRVEKRVFDEIKINRDYIIPTKFLQSSKPADTESWKNEIRRNSLLLVNTLADFGIESKVVAVNRGPVITLYELQIAPGIKVNRIVSLSDDIAMALAASRVRVVAPIPGKSAVGVEIPNNIRENVTLGDIIKSEEYQTRTGYLKVGLGKDILGKPITLDLKRQPHLLIAGATGSGKSVCVNTIISSLVYNYDPNYVRFIMGDPKMVELQLYNGLPHLLTPVITEPAMTPSVLKWAIYEMERRYRLLSSMNTRDIERYNEKVKESRDGGENLPYIVIIIDELADLMMVASKEIEGYITRLAQKSRAVGVHLVLATQRPSVDVITGIIKANFPARIAFQVAQKTDSRTIIDQNGAEKLLGRGDMLYQSPMSSFPIRIQGAFISEDEISEIVEHLEIYGEPCYIDIEESLFAAGEEERDREGDFTEDELFVEALKIVEETRKASASYLQRRLSNGYNRAARIIELMEDRGYVGPQHGSKPREVFI
jgi:S-DNA-T family DNA segregation ATPase FtsK/SpoIIIE